MDPQAPLWIFAYGSLLWRPAFPFRERWPADACGWSRQFWQGSTDHRGVPGAPGRVVTLVQEAGARCCGAAYLVADGDTASVLAALDHRERGGYTRASVELVLRGPEPPPAGRRDCAERALGLTYIAGPANPNYLGPAPLDRIAAQVRKARGPSGTNLEYVLRLADAVHALGGDDPQLFALEALLQGSEAADPAAVA